VEKESSKKKKRFVRKHQMKIDKWEVDERKNERKKERNS